MANTIATVKLLAYEALMVLENEMVLANLVNRDYQDIIGKQGDTVSVKKPYNFVSNAMDPVAGVTEQNIVDDTIDVQINQWEEVTVGLNDREASLQDKVSLRRTLKDMIRPLVEKIETTGVNELTYNTSRSGCVSGITNARLGADKIVDIRTGQRINKVPLSDRANLFGLLSSQDEGALLKDEKFTNGQWTPDGGEALKTAMLGNRYGYSYFPTQLTSQPVITDTSGAVNNAAGYPIGTKILAVDAFSAAPPEGAILTFAGHSTPYTAAAGCTTTGLVLKNGLTAAVADNEVITVLDVSQNIFFHRNALTFVTRPLSGSDNVTPGSIVQVVNYKGYSVRAEMYREPKKKKNLLTLDAVWGWKLTNENLAYKYYTQK